MTTTTTQTTKTNPKRYRVYHTDGIATMDALTDPISRAAALTACRERRDRAYARGMAMSAAKRHYIVRAS
jgi:hypothetical protein